MNQFTQALDHQMATQLLRLAHKYRPETKPEMRQRSLAETKAAGTGGAPPPKRPPVFRAGVNTVTTLGGDSMRCRWARNFFGSDLLDNLGYLINVPSAGVLTANARLKGL